MPYGWGWWPGCAPARERPAPRCGRRRGVTQSSKRAKRKNRRKP